MDRVRENKREVGTVDTASTSHPALGSAELCGLEEDFGGAERGDKIKTRRPREGVRANARATVGERPGMEKRIQAGHEQEGQPGRLSRCRKVAGPFGGLRTCHRNANLRAL